MKSSIWGNRAIWHGMLAFCLIFAVAGAADAQSLVGFWDFEDGAVTDTSGYRAAGVHNGTIFGTGASFASPVNGAPGSSQYLQLTTSSYVTVDNTARNKDGTSYMKTFDFGGPFVISAWVKPDGKLASWDPYVTKFGDTYSGNTYGYQIRREAGSNGVAFTVRSAAGDYRFANANIYHGGWHQLLGVFTGTEMAYYMDGQLLGSKADNWPIALAVNEYLAFGAQDNAGTMRSFSGIAIDDVALFRGRLNTTQLSELVSGVSPTQLSAGGYSLQFSLMSNGYRADSAAAGDAFATIPYFQKAKADSAIKTTWLEGTHFPGEVGDYLQTPAAVLNTTSAGLVQESFTMSVSFMVDDLSATQSILGAGTGSQGQGLHFQVHSDGTLRTSFYYDDLDANTKIEAGKWYNITFTYDSDGKEASIFINGEHDKTVSARPFTNHSVLYLGRDYGGTSKFGGSLKNLVILDEAVDADGVKSLYENTPRATYSFATGDLNEGDWYRGAGSQMFHTATHSNNPMILSYANHNPANSYAHNADNVTGAIWGIPFRVTENELEVSLEVVGCFKELQQAQDANGRYNFSSRTGGGAGTALWDVTVGDFVRDDSGKILTATQVNSSGTTDLGASTYTTTHNFTLEGLAGHDLMVVSMDRQTGAFGWTGLVDVSLDGNAVKSTGAAQTALVVRGYDFDKPATDGGFDGWYEVDPSTGEKLDTISNFLIGSRNGGTSRTNLYIDNSVTAENPLDNTRGFLSTGKIGDEENSSGVLRTDAFLAQGSIMEYMIAGGTANLAFEMVHAESGDVLLTATPESTTNDFSYDFWNLKDVQNQPVYLRVTDANTAGGWSHLELDQIRMVDFLPSQAKVDAWENPFKGGLKSLEGGEKSSR